MEVANTTPSYAYIILILAEREHRANSHADDASPPMTDLWEPRAVSARFNDVLGPQLDAQVIRASQATYSSAPLRLTRAGLPWLLSSPWLTNVS